MEKKIITIGRQFGAGARELGNALAEKLGIPYYDREIIEQTALLSGLSKEFIEKRDEVVTNSFLYSVVMGTRALSGQKTVEEIKMDALRQALNEIAEKGSCVIVGRAADYILKEQSPFRIFVSAEEDDRVKQVSQRENISEKEARKRVGKMDRIRAAYHNEYADSAWGMAESYDLCINLSNISMEKALQMILVNFDAD